MEGINGEYTGEYLPYEFVAKVLYRETLSLDYRVMNNELVATVDAFENTTYILASPLYVSLPHRVSERVRRIDGKNYVAIDDFSMKTKTRRGLWKTGEDLAIVLKNATLNATLVEEADKFQMEIKNMGANITESEFLKIASKYFVIDKKIINIIA